MKQESIEKYEEILRRNPQSQAFAALAEAYRQKGDMERAEKTARKGLTQHPNYVSGHVVLGRVLMSLQRWHEAEVSLLKASSLGPENLLAHQLLGQLYLQTQRPKDALKAFKMALFLNPQNESAKGAVAKLESLSADEYPSDVFEMRKPRPISSMQTPDNIEEPLKTPSGWTSERLFSLVDAYIVRNEIRKARDLLLETRSDFSSDPDWIRRWDMVSPENSITGEKWSDPVPISPNPQRERFIRDRKMQRLEGGAAKNQVLAAVSVVPL